MSVIAALAKAPAAGMAALAATASAPTGTFGAEPVVANHKVPRGQVGETFDGA